MRIVSKRQVVVATAFIIALVAVVAAGQLMSAGTPPASAAATAAEEVVGQALDEAVQMGVPIADWKLDGATLSMTLSSKSTTAVGAPDDSVNLGLAERAAYLAKARGVAVSQLSIQVINAKGESIYTGTEAVTATLDASSAGNTAMAQADTLAAVKSGVAERTDLAGLTVKQFDLSVTGARELHIVATAPDIKAANQSTADLMLGLYTVINNLNAGKQAQIALARVEIYDDGGQTLLNWVYDPLGGSQHWWQAPGMTQDWFETPGP
jgi:hypothetical protein